MSNEKIFLMAISITAMVHTDWRGDMYRLHCQIQDMSMKSKKNFATGYIYYSDGTH